MWCNGLSDTAIDLISFICHYDLYSHWQYFRGLTLKAPITTAADDIHNFHCFSEKIRLDVSSESSEKSSHIFFKDKSKKLKCRLLQFLFGALRVK